MIVLYERPISFHISDYGVLMLNQHYVKTCPFCHQSNYCNIDSKLQCWCQNVSIPNALIELLGEDKKYKACICNACIRFYKANPAEFIAKISANQ